MVEFKYSILNLRLNKHFYGFGSCGLSFWGNDSKKIKFYDDFDSALSDTKLMNMLDRCVVIYYNISQF